MFARSRPVIRFWPSPFLRSISRANSDWIGLRLFFISVNSDTFNRTLALKNGDAVFVSVAGVCDFSPYRVIEELGLVPFVYKGLQELPSGQTSNIHIEAGGDLQRCQAMVIVRPVSARGRVGHGVWGCAQLDVVTRAGLVGFLYLPLVESLKEDEEMPGEFVFPPYAFVRSAPDCKSLEQMLKSDLKALLENP